MSDRKPTRSCRLRPRLQPIVIQPEAIGYALIAGYHRLEAARHLGWLEVRATVLDGLEGIQAREAEIVENLVRSELSPAERAIHVAELKKIYEGKHPETKSTKAGGPGRQKNSSQSLRRYRSLHQRDGEANRTLRARRSARRQTW
jgi:hypothetical protein